jgi:hypothetical protein
MKHTLLISSISLLLSANFSNAQTKIGIGIKAGLNYSNLSRGAENNSMYSIDQRKSFAGYHFGGYVEFRFLKWSMQPELIYSQQGQNFAFGNLGGQETRINYVNIPLTDISKYSGKILPSGVIPFGGWAPIGTVPTKNQVVQVSVGYRLKSLGLK